MKYFIESRGDRISDEIERKMHDALQNQGYHVDEEYPDLVISVGGDGTFLKAFHHFLHYLKHTAFVGVHTGKLGFYADWQTHEVDQLLEDIIGSNLEVVEYPLLKVEIEHEERKRGRYLALNESTIKTTEGSLIMDVHINDVLFESFKGDGLCISTPSGSTAYNKSLGGAIVHPALASIQVTEMASINNRIYRTIGSPLILPKHHVCSLMLRKQVRCNLTIDHITLIEEDVTRINYQVAEEEIRFVRYRPHPFWQRVHSSFID